MSTDMSMLTAFRFFQGCFGAAPVTLGKQAKLPFGAYTVGNKLTDLLLNRWRYDS